MPKKVLFVCTVNRFRSKTAEEIFKSKFNVKSAGTSELANTPLSRELLEWADYIFVMEESHKNIIHKRYPAIYKKKKIICLYIDDVYNYMDKELINLLELKVNNFFKA